LSAQQLERGKSPFLGALLQRLGDVWDETFGTKREDREWIDRLVRFRVRIRIRVKVRVVVVVRVRVKVIDRCRQIG
jgi:hypothetical protein